MTGVQTCALPIFPESKNVDDLLTEMRKERMHMVIVIDEFGTTEGQIGRASCRERVFPVV